MKRKILVNVVCFILLFNSFTVPVNANEDYLSISLADIIVTFYNASGVAIGDTELVNALYQLYGNVTLGQLADAGIIYSTNPAIDTPSKVKDMLGYGNLTAPLMSVSQRRLQDLLGDLPTNSVATDALRAMFDDDIGTPFNNLVYYGLAGLIGYVAEIGKIGYGYYEKIRDWVTDPSDPLLINHSPFSTLKQAYQKFTDSTYFQDLLENSTIGSTPGTDYKDIKLQYPQYCFDYFEDWGYVIYGSTGNNLKYSYEGANVYCVLVDYINHDKNLCYVNIGNTSSTFNDWFTYSSWLINGDTIPNNPAQPQNISANHVAWVSLGDTAISQYGGRIFYMETDHSPSDLEVLDYVRSCLGQSGNGTGITNYINNQVGNIASDNYINLNPNIGTKEYINIFDRIAYIENLNQIENNTDNGDYSQNSTVINNYNNQYIENTIPTARPSTAPAQNPDEQPAQPFVSPRPTQTPEFVESVVQEGGLSSEITTKFPFCIPWDIKALIDNLWAPEARAPYIHWDAEFGSWGKLGEVDIDFSEYDDVAKIFRSTTLLLWIVGLIVLTRNMIG